jgi:hypothetical protein
MTLEKTTTVDQITVVENGTVFYRTVERIFENNKALSECYVRYTLLPGQDTANLPENVKAVCIATWTPEIIAAWNEKSQTSVNPTEPLQ